MPHDPVRSAEIQAWLALAAEDLRAADHELTAAPPIYGDLVFHCQQAVEKLFKAFLVRHDVVFRKTHNLEELGEQCLGVDPTLRQIIDRAVPLTEYAWRFRYPGETESPTDEEARDALAVARAVSEAITTRLR
jgi:HEPN domain-containing protein